MEICLTGKERFFEAPKELAGWANSTHEELNLTEDEAQLLLNYAEGHGYRVGINSAGMFYVWDEDPLEPDKPCDFNYFVEKMCAKNDEWFQMDPLTPEEHEQYSREGDVLYGIWDRCKTTYGYSIKGTKVKDLIEVLKTLPEDYDVCDCGSEAYLYVFPYGDCMSLDTEAYLA